MNIGDVELTTKEEAQKKWKISCIDYVNGKIAKAINNQMPYAELLKDKMFSELINELKNNFDIIADTEKRIVILWE